jgi:hypothetical protein
MFKRLVDHTTCNNVVVRFAPLVHRCVVCAQMNHCFLALFCLVFDNVSDQLWPRKPSKILQESRCASDFACSPASFKRLLFPFVIYINIPFKTFADASVANFAARLCVNIAPFEYVLLITANDTGVYQYRCEVGHARACSGTLQ